MEDRILQEFREKEDFFLYGYERGLSPFEWNKLNLGSFLDTLFQRGKDWEECFEEIQSHEYKVWKKQKDEESEEIDYRSYRQFRYNPIVFSKEGKKNLHRVLLKDDFETLKWCEGRKFAIMSPATFVGRNNTNKNARYLYAIAIDLDGVEPKHLQGFCDMAHGGKFCPIPNILVNSGHGLHVYYLLKEPVALLDENTWRLMQKIKENMTLLVWQEGASTYIKKQNVQLQPILQGFRLPGTLTKFGAEITAWETIGVKEYTLEELNAFSSPDYALSKAEIKSIGKYYYNPNKITLEEAKRRFPEWYEHKVVQKKRFGRTWKLKRGVYDWWLNKIKQPNRERVGHRYWCVMMLFVYASRSGVPFKEVMSDAMALIPSYDFISLSQDNRFTEDDVKSASKAYNDGKGKFSIDKIERLTAERIEGKRRNGRTRAEHIKLMNLIRDNIKYADKDWRNKDGRPKEQAKVQAWREANPMNTNKSQCARETNLDRKTVRKWWDSLHDVQE